mgnify:CR=1 FL=1|jgi:hypothetical protein
MDRSMDVNHTLASEPDSPQLMFASRFILAVAIFVAASMVGLRGWLGEQMTPATDIAAETQR